MVEQIVVPTYIVSIFFFFFFFYPPHELRFKALEVEMNFVVKREKSLCFLALFIVDGEREKEDMCYKQHACNGTT